jgi:hypothetical protein
MFGWFARVIATQRQLGAVHHTIAAAESHHLYQGKATNIHEHTCLKSDCLDPLSVQAFNLTT